MLFQSFFEDDFFAPFRRLDRTLGAELLRPWSGLQRRVGFPAVNVYTSADSAMVTAEVPGLAAADLDLEVLGNTLTIKGKRAEHELGEERKLLRRERSLGDFEKTVTLPFRVDPEKVEAQLRHGILVVKLGRPEEDQPRRIAITAQS